MEVTGVTDFHRHLAAIVSLPAVCPQTVARVLNVALRKVSENPYWEFYQCGPHGPFSEVQFKLSRQGLAWLLAWTYEPSQAPREQDLDFTAYGLLQNLDLNPRIPPEGTEIRQYCYMGLKLFLEFTARSRRLRGAALHRD